VCSIWLDTARREAIPQQGPSKQKKYPLLKATNRIVTNEFGLAKEFYSSYAGTSFWGQKKRKNH
jgi:hypothetical protein